MTIETFKARLKDFCKDKAYAVCCHWRIDTNSYNKGWCDAYKTMKELIKEEIENEK